MGFLAVDRLQNKKTALPVQAKSGFYKRLSFIENIISSPL